MLYNDGILPTVLDLPAELEPELSESMGEIIIVCDLSILVGAALGPPGTEGAVTGAVLGGAMLLCELFLGGSLVSRAEPGEDPTPSPIEPKPLSFLVTLALRPSEAKKAPVLLVGVKGLKDLYPLAGDSLPLVLPADEFDLPGNLGLEDANDGYGRGGGPVGGLMLISSFVDKSVAADASGRRGKVASVITDVCEDWDV